MTDYIILYVNLSYFDVKIEKNAKTIAYVKKKQYLCSKF